MENKLTDRQLWEEYWRNSQFAPVSNRPVYKKYIPPLTADSRFIEIGGFPGLNAAYFYRNVCRDVTLLDFYVDQSVIQRVERQNGIPAGTIKTIEADFLTFTPRQQYDLVFSLGFIEHFADTEDVIRRHSDLLAEGGRLLILLPNLRGLNGMVQRLFNPENLRIHNLESMDIPLLSGIARKLELNDIQVGYTRKPMIWLEPKPGLGNRIGRITVKAASYFIKLFPVKCRFLSPYIVLSARK